MLQIEIKLGGKRELSTIVDKTDYLEYDLASYNWSPKINLRDKIIYATGYDRPRHKLILLHRLIMEVLDAPRSVLIDHIDHNGLNNSRINLRITNNKGNQQNRRKHPINENTSFYKGVNFDSKNKTNPWRAYIKYAGKVKHLGYYKTEIDAALAYNKAATEHFGDMAFLNIPK